MSRFCVSWVLFHGGIRFLEDIIITAKNVCYVNKEQQSQHHPEKVCFTHVWASISHARLGKSHLEFSVGKLAKLLAISFLFLSHPY